MLKSVDILIGLSVVMLVVSMAVTLINQAILNLLASRGHNLRDGLADLLELLDAGMTRKEAETIVEKTLSHPIIGGKIKPWVPSWLRPVVQFFKYGDVIHREEFIKILLGLSMFDNSKIQKLLTDIGGKIANGIQAKQKAAIDTDIDNLKKELEKTLAFAKGKFDRLINNLKTAANADDQQLQYKKLLDAISRETPPLETLKNVLKANGIENPTSTLKNVRMLALEYEKSQPELAHDVRQTNALLQEASSEFLAKISMNFDQVIDRVSVRFTSTTRVVTFFSAALVAIVLQLDTVNIMNRLAMDDAMRVAFVETAFKLDSDKSVKDLVVNSKTGTEQSSSENSDKDQTQPSTEEDKAKQEAYKEKEKEYLVFLAHQGVINLSTDVCVF